jgi:hypothetical protein
MMHRLAMRRPIGAILAAAFALAVVAVGCGTFAFEPVATLDDIRGPWRPAPLAMDNATIAAAGDACQDARKVGGPDMAPLDQLVVADARGSGRLTLLYAGAGRSFMQCELRVDARGELSMIGGWSQNEAGPELLLAQDDVRIVQSGGVLGDAGLASYANGRIGPAVARVQLVFIDGSVVRASIGGGWFTAWWPTDEMAFVVQAFDATGNKIGEVDG